MNSSKLIFIFSWVSLWVTILGCSMPRAESPEVIDLAGVWQVVLDSLAEGDAGAWYQQKLKGHPIHLPGTLDDAGLGKPNNLEPALNNYVLSHLARKHEYIGQAWYQRDFQVPVDDAVGGYVLELERVLWESAVWINGQQVGTSHSLTTPHRYDITAHLKPGKNQITIRIDNSNFYPFINVTSDKYPGYTSGEMAHGYTNHTQTKWNGILGRLQITKLPKSGFSQLQVYPSLIDSTLRFTVAAKTDSVKDVPYEIWLNGQSLQKGRALLTSAGQGFSSTIQLEKAALSWSESDPNLYTLQIGNKALRTTFGFRDVSNINKQLTLNGDRIYLRGTLECAVFPLSGYPYTSKADWRRIMENAKAYGLNHLRFHSWCPPKAAFEAADELGLFLQAELPHWSLKVGTDSLTKKFLYHEAQRILLEYGNHPSFLLMSLGNELEGDMTFLNDLTATLKAKDQRRLYATTSFSFQKDAGSVAQPEDDYLVTQWTDKGWIRGQGIFNAVAPHFDKDYNNEVAHIDIPVISHEIGQYSVFPDLSEIDKYTGNLQPLNFVAVHNDLKQKQLLRYAPQFTLASGNLAGLLYKEEIERALKTPGFDGFQLLQLQDFPGQGTALVGLLNAFWESKGIIDSTTFRQFCGPVVPLLRFEKSIYENGETFNAAIQIANFSKPMDTCHIRWYIRQGAQQLSTGLIPNNSLCIGNENYPGSIRAVLNVDKASQLTVGLEIVGTPYRNEWNIWVYPIPDIQAGNVVYTRSFEEAKTALGQGKKVLLNPDYKTLKGVDGRFVPVFWSPVHFPDQPSTMGILCDPDHPALAHFPTNFHSDWQWWGINLLSKALVLDELGVDPIVRVIDNFVTNRSLGNVFEAQVAQGNLMVVSIDLDTDLHQRPAARQLKYSLMSYMRSSDFKPTVCIPFEQIEALKQKQ